MRFSVSNRPPCAPSSPSGPAQARQRRRRQVSIHKALAAGRTGSRTMTMFAHENRDRTWTVYTIGVTIGDVYDPEAVGVLDFVNEEEARAFIAAEEARQ